MSFTPTLCVHGRSWKMSRERRWGAFVRQDFPLRRTPHGSSRRSPRRDTSTIHRFFPFGTAMGECATHAASLIEFPISVADLFGKPMCFFGGGYLRLFPYALIRRMARRVLAEGRPVVYYVHPREIDPAHPRLPMSAVRRFKSYVNLHSTEVKLRRILREFPTVTFREYLAMNAAVLGPAYVH